MMVSGVVPETKRLLNFDEPISLRMIAVLHFLGPNDGPGPTARHLPRCARARKPPRDQPPRR